MIRVAATGWVDALATEARSARRLLAECIHDRLFEGHGPPVGRCCLKGRLTLRRARPGFPPIMVCAHRGRQVDATPLLENFGRREQPCCSISLAPGTGDDGEPAQIDPDARDVTQAAKPAQAFLEEARRSFDVTAVAGQNTEA